VLNYPSFKTEKQKLQKNKHQKTLSNQDAD